MRYLVSAAVLAVVNLAMWALLLLPRVFVLEPDPRGLAVFGILLSALMLACLVSAGVGKEIPAGSSRREAVGLIAVAAVLLGFGVVFDKVDAVAAALVLICGSAALLIGLSAVQELKEKSGFEITSHWGGFGGSIGGWRVSSAVTAVVLALIFLGAAVGVAGMGGGDTADKGATTTTSTKIKTTDSETNTVDNKVDNKVDNTVDNTAANKAADDAAAAGANDTAPSPENKASPAELGPSPSGRGIDNPDAQ